MDEELNSILVQLFSILSKYNCLEKRFPVRYLSELRLQTIHNLYWRCSAVLTILSGRQSRLDAESLIEAELDFTSLEHFKNLARQAIEQLNL